jgi:hypothetical protein
MSPVKPRRIWTEFICQHVHGRGQMERVRLDEVGEHYSGLVNGSLLMLSSHSPGRRFGNCVGYMHGNERVQDSPFGGR